MKQHRLTNEEQAFKDKLEQASFDYRESDWREIESKVGKSTFKTKYGRLVKISAALVIISSISYFIVSETNKQVKPETTVKELTQADQESQVKKETSLDNKGKRENRKTDNSAPQKIESEDNESQPNKVQNQSKIKIKSNEEVKLEPEPNSTQLTKKERPTETNENQVIKPQVRLLGIKSSGKACINETVELEAITLNFDQSDHKYQWKINSKVQNTDRDRLKLNLINAETTHIQLSLIDAEGNKISSIDSSFTPYEQETPDFTYNDHQGLFNDFTATFSAKSENKNYIWVIKGDSINSGTEISYTFPTKGIYDVSLISKSKNGCLSKISKPVAIKDDFAPFINAFTPNGDKNNEEFIPQGFETFDGAFEFIIFDLSGNVIYSTNSVNEPWNGRLNNNGQLMPFGYYVWKIMVSDNKGNQRSFTNRVMLRESK